MLHGLLFADFLTLICESPSIVYFADIAVLKEFGEHFLGGKVESFCQGWGGYELFLGHGHLDF